MPDELTVGRTDVDNLLGKPYKCILFNDEHHSMDEVVSQLMKATGCSPQRATAIMIEAHTAGRAICAEGHRERCEYVSAVLEEIQLGTKVEPA